MEDKYLELGALAAVAILLIKEIFSFLGKSNTNSSLQTVVQNNTDALHRLDTMLEIIQERMRTHEENACRRHMEVVGKRVECEKEHEHLEAVIIGKLHK
jgi:hypothetical protein